jgi:hypothetical protein
VRGPFGFAFDAVSSGLRDRPAAVTPRVCDACNAANAMSAKFCSQCGTRLADT